MVSSLLETLKQTRQSLRRLASSWRNINLRRFLFLPRLLDAKEKRLFLILIAVAVTSGGTALVRAYWTVTQEAPDAGGSYTEGLFKDPRTINPVYASQDTDRDIARLVFSGLITYDGDGTMVPELAEKIDVSPDGKIYTVELRKNIAWHDGKPFGADDVVFTVKTVQNPQYKSPLRANWQGVAVEKTGEDTIRFTLRTPYAPFIENLTLGIIPKHLWENVAPEQTILHELNIKPVGTGPYRFKQFKQNKDGSMVWYELERNNLYGREGPYIKTITFYFYKTEDQMLSAWRRGDIEGFGPVPAHRAEELANRKSKILSIAMPRIFGVFLNEKRAKILADKRLREAIARAIDKEKIAQQAVSGGSTRFEAPLGSLGMGNQETALYPYSPDRARALLEESGWKDYDGNGTREKKTVEQKKEVMTPLRLTLTTSDWPDLLHSAQLLKEMLSGIGIEVAVEQYSFAELETSVIRPRNFDMLLFGHVYGYEPDPFAFWHSSQIKDPGLNISLYNNPKADRLLEEARKTNDADLRKKKYDEFSSLIARDIPAVFLFSQLYLYLVPSDIQGIDVNKISLPADRFNTMNLWYRNTKRVFK